MGIILVLLINTILVDYGGLRTPEEDSIPSYRVLLQSWNTQVTTDIDGNSMDVSSRTC